MDLKLYTAEDPEVTNYNWDIDVVDGVPITIEGDEEIGQLATVAAYLALGSVPLMEHKGNDWAGYLLNGKTLTQVDNQVRKNITTYTNAINYAPVYTISNEKLNINIANVQINTGAM